MKVCLHVEAQSDLLSIREYIAAKNSRRASTFVRELLDKIEGLAHMGESFPVIARYARSGLRRRIHRNYQIIYRVFEEQDTVDVLHVLHTSRDNVAFLAAWE